jgi:hypothetical protein
MTHNCFRYSSFICGVPGSAGLGFRRVRKRLYELDPGAFAWRAEVTCVVVTLRGESKSTERQVCPLPTRNALSYLTDLAPRRDHRAARLGRDLTGTGGLQPAGPDAVGPSQEARLRDLPQLSLHPWPGFRVSGPALAAFCRLQPVGVGTLLRNVSTAQVHPSDRRHADRLTMRFLVLTGSRRPSAQNRRFGVSRCWAASAVAGGRSCPASAPLLGTGETEPMSAWVLPPT